MYNILVLSTLSFTAPLFPRFKNTKSGTLITDDQKSTLKYFSYGMSCMSHTILKACAKSNIFITLHISIVRQRSWKI